jgi:ATP-dependent Clp protease protease subunit
MENLMEEQQEERPTPTPSSEKIELSLLESRRIMLSDTVDSKLAENIIKKLWYLDLLDSSKPILLVINSPGGSVDAGFAIWDQIKMIKAPVTTLITGLAASIASVIALAGAPKRRFATPNSRIMIHQPLIAGVIQGQATDLEIHAREILKTKSGLVDLYVRETGNERSIIEKAIDRDTWMTAKEALDFGHINAIVNSFKDL